MMPLDDVTVPQPSASQEETAEVPVSAKVGASPRHHWRLAPEICFLNHGSFGACPRPVLEAQARYRDQLEQEPVRFFMREAPPLLAAARARLAAFLGAAADDLAFVPNVTTALNAVLWSVPLRAGDELLITDHEYNATKNIACVVADARDARVVVARLPFPCASEDVLVQAVLDAVTPRTRYAVLDHVTSQTALVLPIARLVQELQGRGVDVIVDGAHAPGMVPVALDDLGAAFYGGNCHKWLCAPKGAGFLHVRADRQSVVRPTVISHGASEPVTGSGRFRIEFDWVGTVDPTPWLTVPDALDFIGSLDEHGWPGVMRRNRALAVAGRRRLAESLGVDLPCPDSMLGSMASLPLPLFPGFPTRPEGAAFAVDSLQDALFQEHAVEVPVMDCPAHPGRLLRIALHLYNTIADCERLAAALQALQARR